MWLIDPSITETLARIPWIADGVNETEWTALSDVERIASEDIELATMVANLPWFTDDVTEDERWALADLANTAAFGNVELATMVANLPWFIDDITEAEKEDLQLLHSLQSGDGSRDTELAKTIERLSWIDDGVSENERSALKSLVNIPVNDFDLVNMVTKLPWFIDGITEDERWALSDLRHIVFNDIELAKTVVELPWFIDDIASYEQEALGVLNSIAYTDAELARMAANLPLFANTITEGYVHVQALHGLRSIAEIDTDLAWWLASSVNDQTRDLIHIHVIESLWTVSHKGDTLRQLTSQPWFADGLDNEESAFLVVLCDIVEIAPQLYQDLLDSRFIQTKTISLPLAGDVNIYIVQTAPFPPDEDLLSIIEDAASIYEEFLGAPFPTTDAIIHVIDSVYTAGNALRSSHGNWRVNLIRSEDTVSVGSLVHEIAHYYFTAASTGPRWLTEGAAEFMERYFYYRTSDQDLSTIHANAMAEAQICTDGLSVENIQHLELTIRNRWSTDLWDLNICRYRMGENFLWNVYGLVGEEALSSALRELHLSELRRHKQTHRIAEVEEDIYRVFLKHAPADKKEEFRDLYQRLHGGTFAFEDVAFDDDHGDEAGLATEIAVGESVEGALDYILDFDYFRFRAEEGQRYRMTVTHDTLRSSSIALFAPDGTTGENHHWKAREMTSTGPRILWIAPTSDEYYFAVQNFGGKTGAYTLTITPVDPIEDDHGDTIATATNISLGEVVQGTVDGDFDYDYFQFQAVGGESYRVVIEPATLEHHHLHLYTADGVPHYFDFEFGYLSLDNRVRGSQTVIGELTAPSSGPSYLAIDGARGSIGTYTVTITAVD